MMTLVELYFSPIGGFSSSTTTHKKLTTNTMFLSTSTVYSMVEKEKQKQFSHWEAFKINYKSNQILQKLTHNLDTNCSLFTDGYNEPDFDVPENVYRNFLGLIVDSELHQKMKLAKDRITSITPNNRAHVVLGLYRHLLKVMKEQYWFKTADVVKTL